MIEIIAGVIVLILAIIGIAKLVSGRGGGGASSEEKQASGAFLKQLQSAAYLALDQIGDVSSLAYNPNKEKLIEAIKESGRTNAYVDRAAKNIRYSEQEAMRELQIEKARLDNYLQLFELQRKADTTAKLIYEGRKVLTRDEISEYVKQIMGGFKQGEKGLYKLRNKVVSG